MRTSILLLAMLALGAHANPTASQHGIALTPANLWLGWHMRFVHLAFRTFLVVVLLYGTATWRHAQYPKRYAIGWFAFAILLAGYVGLLIAGPSASALVTSCRRPSMSKRRAASTMRSLATW